MVEPSHAFVSFSIGEERVVEAYSQAILSAQVKCRLLASPIPFSLRDEIELHKCVIAYIDVCISHLKTLFLLAGYDQQVLPLEHNLLRKFRDANHHVGYKAFVPFRSGDTKAFYVWPVLNCVASIRGLYPDWCNAPNDMELAELLELNQLYLVRQSEKVAEQVGALVKSHRFYEDYPISEVSFGALRRRSLQTGSAA